MVDLLEAAEHVAQSALETQTGVLQERETLRGPQVILPSVGPGDDTITVNNAARALFEVIAATEEMFVRGGRVHEISVDDTGNTALVPLSVEAFVARVQLHADLWAWRVMKKDEVLKPVAKLPAETAGALMAAPEAREILPPIASVQAAPGLALNGAELVTLQPGYNPLAGGVLVTGRVAVEDVPLEEAVQLLTSLLDDYSFPTVADRSRALATLIAPGLRMAQLIPGHSPLLVFEADKSQGGKGYFFRLVGAIYAEPLATIAQRQGGVGSLDETISQKLIDGRPFITLDNLRGRIDSTLFEMLLTAPGSYGARVPHRGEVQVDPRRYVFFATSNGVEMTPDLANRALITRIQKQPADYVFTEFPEGDLLAHVAANQARYLGAIHTVIQTWFVAGRQRTRESRHSFREWAQICDWIVRELFHAAPLLDGHDEIQRRTADPGKAWLRAVSLVVLARPAIPSWSASRLA